MSKTITIRLSDTEYNIITKCAKMQHRPISNFITNTVINDIESSKFVDSIEMSQINNDHSLLTKINSGFKDVKKMKGQFVG
jgi:uncharacterized protein (DUF1778 family)